MQQLSYLFIYNSTVPFNNRPEWAVSQSLRCFSSHRRLPLIMCPQYEHQITDQNPKSNVLHSLSHSYCKCVKLSVRSGTEWMFYAALCWPFFETSQTREIWTRRHAYYISIYIFKVFNCSLIPLHKYKFWHHSIIHHEAQTNDIRVMQRKVCTTQKVQIRLKGMILGFAEICSQPSWPSYSNK